MSWVQLLAVSKSIDSVPDRPSPYKMTQQNLLPRFGAERGERTNEGSGTEFKSEAKASPEADLFRATAVPAAPVPESRSA